LATLKPESAKFGQNTYTLDSTVASVFEEIKRESSCPELGCDYLLGWVEQFEEKRPRRNRN